jgi:ATP-dependent RNA helicase RhlE
LNFSDLLLAEPILRSVTSEGYTVPTPVQAEAIPHILQGRDVLGCAQTGTGKTAAFALPILHRLSIVARPGGVARPRCLVLSPTRELANQISDSFRVYGKHVGLQQAVVYGGVGISPQISALRRGVDILIATPGRLLDLMGQGCCDLRSVEILVLDEADRMLDMGFIVDIRKIISKLPGRRQTLLFSATMPTEIRKLSGAILHDPVTIQTPQTTHDEKRIDQSVYFVDRGNKPALLAHLVNNLPMARAIVFTRTKHGADRVVRRLHASGIRAEAIHGNKSQNARQRALQNFRTSKVPVLVATDVASRGIDVDGITHVVNYDLTDEPETYVHRIGRTARAGASGAAVSFCDQEERSNLRAIEKLLRRSLAIKTDHPVYTAASKNDAPHNHEPRERQQQSHPRQPQPSRAPRHPDARHHNDSRSHHTPNHQQRPHNNFRAPVPNKPAPKPNVAAAPVATAVKHQPKRPQGRPQHPMHRQPQHQGRGVVPAGFKTV